jgi:hypothetical protein
MAEDRDDDHYHGRYREQRGQTGFGNLQKLIAAGALTAGGLLANPALSEGEKAPPPPLPVRSIPSVPVAPDRKEPDTFALNVQVREPKGPEQWAR